MNTECAWCSRPSAGMGAEPRPTVPAVDGFAFAHESATRPVDKRTRPPPPPPPSLKKRSEALKTAFTRLFGMKRRVPPRRRREGAALQGSGGATPCQGAASRRRAGRPGGGRSAKRATAFLLPPSGGSSSYSTALDLVKPTAGAAVSRRETTKCASLLCRSENAGPFRLTLIVERLRKEGFENPDYASSRRFQCARFGRSCDPCECSFQLRSRQHGQSHGAIQPSQAPNDRCESRSLLACVRCDLGQPGNA